MIAVHHWCVKAPHQRDAIPAVEACLAESQVVGCQSIANGPGDIRIDT